MSGDMFSAAIDRNFSDEVEKIDYHAKRKKTWDEIRKNCKFYYENSCTLIGRIDCPEFAERNRCPFIYFLKHADRLDLDVD
mgnify:CR=1 FL=1